MLSAVEGLEVVSPRFKEWVIPLTLVVLFVPVRGAEARHRRHRPVLRAGHAGVVRSSSPLLGVSHIVRHPEILQAISPHYAVLFMCRNPGTTFIILGAVVLCVTGAEALYADLGHFGKRPIRLAWFCVAMPALTLNYFGQGALLLARPGGGEEPVLPDGPGLGAAAAGGAWPPPPRVIASQALITGAFSVTKQVVQLGYLPRLNIQHTSVRDTGQIYIPAVNWGLFVAIVLAVVMFRSSSSLAAAYGIAVTLDMLITTTLTFFVIRYGWKYPLALCIAATGWFFVVDLAFFASNLLKLFAGGWFPLAIGGAVFTLDDDLEAGARHPQRTSSRPTPSTCRASSKPCSSTRLHASTARRYSSRRNRARFPTRCCTTSSTTRCCTITTCSSPCTAIPCRGSASNKRLEIEPLGHDCWQVRAALRLQGRAGRARERWSMLEGRGCRIEPMTTSYFLSRDIVMPTLGSGMAPWREKMFAQMHHNASAAADFLKLPNNAVVELGARSRSERRAFRKCRACAPGCAPAFPAAGSTLRSSSRRCSSISCTAPSASPRAMQSTSARARRARTRRCPGGS